MSKMASARVPDELFEQGIDSLNLIGSNATALINAAFAYVVQTGELPLPSPSAPRSHMLTDEQRADLVSKLAASRLAINLPDEWDYKEELASGKWADYEALS